MFQHQIARNEIHRGIRHGPSLSDIRNRKGYVFMTALLSSLFDHRRREVDSVNLLTDFA